MSIFDKLVTNRMKCNVGGAIGGAIGGIFGGGGGGGGDAAVDASNIQAQAQREALDYYKKQMALPTELRDQALGSIQDIYFGGGGMDALKSNPMYQMQMQGAEESALRNAAATGKLRSGQSIMDVTAAQNRAAMNTLGGLQGLAGFDTGAQNIANMMSGIGQTQAQGIIGQAQNQAAANQAGFGNILGLGNLALGAYQAFSDERLKDNINPTGKTENGIPTYTWTWNKEANKLGLHGSGYGTLSKVVKEIKPEAVTTKDGYDQVNYGMIGISHG